MLGGTKLLTPLDTWRHAYDILVGRLLEPDVEGGREPTFGWIFHFDTSSL